VEGGADSGGGQSISLVIEDMVEEHAEAHVVIDVILAATRPKRMKSLLHHVGQLGVRHLTATTADKVEKSYLESGILTSVQDAQRHRILLDGVMQGGVSSRVPQVVVQKQYLRKWMEDPLSFDGMRYDAKILLHPEGGVRMLELVASELRAQRERTGRLCVCLALGPEGGWTPRELTLFREQGFTMATMGRHVLRSDSAFITAVGMVRALEEPDPVARYPMASS
jgi:16S rRNA (uracil1498-N3)-methyltransferase